MQHPSSPAKHQVRTSFSCRAMVPGGVCWSPSCWRRVGRAPPAGVRVMAAAGPSHRLYEPHCWSGSLAWLPCPSSGSRLRKLPGAGAGATSGQRTECVLVDWARARRERSPGRCTRTRVGSAGLGTQHDDTLQALPAATG